MKDKAYRKSFRLRARTYVETHEHLKRWSDEIKLSRIKERRDRHEEASEHYRQTGEA